MNRPPVTRGLIPCGGKGTRMASFNVAGTTAKELLPMGGIPIVLRVMAECAASGAREVLIVSAPGKHDLERAVLAAAGSPGMPEKARIVVQQEARGLADAIRLGRDFAENSPLAVALPDNLFLSDVPALSQLIDVYQRSGKSVVAIIELSAANREHYGPTAVYTGRVDQEEFIIASIPDKDPREKTFNPMGVASAFTGVGRYVFLPEVFTAIDEVELSMSSGSELDDVPVLQLILQRGRLTGCLVRGEFLDVGLPSGYIEAEARFRRG